LPKPLLRLVPQPAPRPWSYIMLGEQEATAALDRILSGPKPLTTIRVWHAIVFSTDWDTGEIVAGAEALAEKARVPPAEVRRALPAMVKLGVLERRSRGRYAVNPNMAWKGSMTARDRAAARWGMRITSP